MNKFNRAVPLIRSLLSKVPLPILISGILFFNVFLFFLAGRVSLPDTEHPILFYSNQARQDIQRLFLSAFREARHSIFVSIYGCSDPSLIRLLNKKSQQHLAIQVEYDPSASAPLSHLLAPSITSIPIKTQGLMHRKIAVVDHTSVFLGSANFTPTSLRHHSNLVVGLFHPDLAAYLEHPFSNSFTFTLPSQEGILFLLPDPGQKSLQHLLCALEKAQHHIHIAMFTLTHREITQALICAKQRGVSVRVAIDYYTAKGASKKMLRALQKAGIHVQYSQGKELLHYKWALIDDSTLIMGSANWTQAAFTKNQDFLLFLTPLNQQQQTFFHSLWDTIETESICVEND